MTSQEWKNQHDAMGALTFSRRSVEILIEQYAECEAERQKWSEEAQRLYHICESLNDTAIREHAERELIYTAIDEYLGVVEDYTNPEKGITELEAYLDAIKRSKCPECPL